MGRGSVIPERRAREPAVVAGTDHVFPRHRWREPRFGRIVAGTRWHRRTLGGAGGFPGTRCGVSLRGRRLANPPTASRRAGASLPRQLAGARGDGCVGQVHQPQLRLARGGGSSVGQTRGVGRRYTASGSGPTERPMRCAHRAIVSSSAWPPARTMRLGWCIDAASPMPLTARAERLSTLTPARRQKSSSARMYRALRSSSSRDALASTMDMRPAGGGARRSPRRNHSAAQRAENAQAADSAPLRSTIASRAGSRTSSTERSTERSASVVSIARSARSWS